MANILSQKNDNVALLKRLLSKREEVLISRKKWNKSSPFKSQKEIFSKAQSMHAACRTNGTILLRIRATNDKIEIATILSMPKPYAWIKDLSELMQDVNAAYDALLTHKKKKKRSQRGAWEMSIRLRAKAVKSMRMR